MRSSAPAADLEALDEAIVACRACPRLITWCRQVAATKRAAYAGEEYWGGPVPGFGSTSPRVWIVGLAPGAHGANRTGRMFTGDRSGDWLFGSLYRVGLAALPTSVRRDDGQRLGHVRITAAVHCAPPGNTPTPAERASCAAWLANEAELVEPTISVVVALGTIAWNATRATLRKGRWSVPPGLFGHGRTAMAISPSGRGVEVLGCYHPSQQNTFTGRLTEPMLDDVMSRAAHGAGLA